MIKFIVSFLFVKPNKNYEIGQNGRKSDSKSSRSQENQGKHQIS